jgi:hypothetical protein
MIPENSKFVDMILEERDDGPVFYFGFLSDKQEHYTKIINIKYDTTWKEFKRLIIS